MATNLLQPTFAGGELSPSLYSRVDIARYGTSLRTCRNMIVRPYGGVENRPGTRFVGEIKDSTEIGRLVPFQYSSEIAYVIVANDGVFEFIYRGAYLESSPGVRVQVAVPYTSAEIFDLKFTQSADVMYLTHANHAPRELRRTSATTFELSEFRPKNGPFQTVNSDEARKMAASATTGQITLTTNFDAFTADMVNSLVYLEPKDLADTKPWEPGERNVATGQKRRSDGKTYIAEAHASNGGDNWYQTGANKPVHDEGSAWDGPGDQRTSGTDKYTIGVKWRFLHGGFGTALITGYVDARTVNATVVKTLPDAVVGGLGSPGTTWTFSGNGVATVFSITGAVSSDPLNYSVEIGGAPVQGNPYYDGGDGRGACVTVETFVVVDGRGIVRAGTVAVGERLLRGDGTFGEVTHSEAAMVPCVRIVDNAIAHLECSTSAPIQSGDMFRLAPDMLGHATPRWIMDRGIMDRVDDRMVTDIVRIGEQKVQHITLAAETEADRVFLASADGTEWWAHHNIKKLEP